MINIFKQIDKFYKREVELKPKRQFFLYIVLTIAAVVFFGVFGLIINLDILLSNMKSGRSLAVVESNLRKRNETLEELSRQIEEIDPYFESLYAAVPENKNTQDFLEETVRTTSEKGYLLHDLKIDEIRANDTTIEILMEGNIEGLHELVKSFEELDRYSEVLSVSTFVSEESTMIKLEIKIYYLERSS